MMEIIAKYTEYIHEARWKRPNIREPNIFVRELGVILLNANTFTTDWYIKYDK